MNFVSVDMTVDELKLVLKALNYTGAIYEECDDLYDSLTDRYQALLIED